MAVMQVIQTKDDHLLSSYVEWFQIRSQIFFFLPRQIISATGQIKSWSTVLSKFWNLLICGNNVFNVQIS